MSLITLLIVVLIFAVIVWVINYIPMDAKLKTIINVILALIFVIWLPRMLWALPDFRV